MEATPTANSSLVPAAIDVLLAVPRFARRAGAFAVDNIAGNIFNGGSVIADATGKQTVRSTITNTSAALAASTAARLDAALREGVVAASTTAAEDDGSLLGLVFQFVGKVKNFGGVFAYLTSRWALATFTAAVILNRAQFYASSREHLRLRWYIRLALYAVPIALFLDQLQIVLEAMRCQTSPDFPLMRYGDPLKQLAIDFAGEGGLLYDISSSLLFWQDDATCCSARKMSLLAGNGINTEMRGTMSILFRFFLSLCGSQLFETLACALQGRQPLPETGMTIFEHSLAFAECEAMISSALGFGFFGLSNPDMSGPKATSDAALISRSEILQRLNVPPEVLLVCLISCFSHLSSAFLAVVGLRDRVRLINSGVWACSYMGAFIWSFSRVIMQPVDNITDLGVLRFPTVCIVGFIPHLLISIGIVTCSIIYGFSLLITALSVPDDVLAGLSSFKDRFSWAYSNLQANVQFSQASSIRIKMSEDFYTTLLKIGFNVLTAASEAVYLNEGNPIKVEEMTWLERKRIDEIAAQIERRRRVELPAEILGEGIAKGVGFFDYQHSAISANSPYARERRSRPHKSDYEQARQGGNETGLGMTERRGRFQLTFDFLTGLFWLVIGLEAQMALKVLDRIGIQRRPEWLTRAAGGAAKRGPSSIQSNPNDQALEFWMLDQDGRLAVPQNTEVDVEVETRHRLRASGQYEDEEGLGENLYGWWKNGGWWGDIDSSGDYHARDTDDDATSMISMSTNFSVASDDSQAYQSGQRTPTLRNPYADRKREETPPVESEGVALTVLSRLLNPQTATEREQARLLSHSLQSSRPLTRSQYRRRTDRERAQLLTGLRARGTEVSEEEEERELEEFILAQRRKNQPKPSAVNNSSNSWASGADGMGPSGPQCVVCQSAPRTVLVWPCGCLSTCDDCRVGLAARNHSKCICCRTDLAAYSRLYVP